MRCCRLGFDGVDAVQQRRAVLAAAAASDDMGSRGGVSSTAPTVNW